MKRAVDVALFVGIVAVLGGASGAAVSHALGGSFLWTGLGVGAGLVLGLAYAGRMRSRPGPPS